MLHTLVYWNGSHWVHEGAWPSDGSRSPSANLEGRHRSPGWHWLGSASWFSCHQVKVARQLVFGQIGRDEVPSWDNEWSVVDLPIRLPEREPCSRGAWCSICGAIVARREQAVTQWLLERGYDERETEAILRSKHMRWAADMSDRDYGSNDTSTLAKYLERYQIKATDLAELVEGTS